MEHKTAPVPDATFTPPHLPAYPATPPHLPPPVYPSDPHVTVMASSQPVQIVQQQIRNQAVISHPRPNNYLAVSIFACLLCFWPTGLIAIINALEVDSRYARGDYKGAALSSVKARKWAKVSIVLGGILTGLYFALSVILSIAGELINYTST